MMLVNRAIAGLLVLSSSSTTFLASAFPTGAGTCIVDTATGPVFPDGTAHFGFGQGDLTSVPNGTYVVDIDGTPLNPGASNAVNVTSTSQVTISAVSATGTRLSMRGFLITLSATGQDLAGALTPSTGDSQALTSSGSGSNENPAICPAGVAGGTHTLNDNKNAVSMGLSNIPNGAVEMTVTVMRRAQRWYFNAFSLTVTSDANVTTEAPTMMPTANETDTNATMAPTPMNGTDTNATMAPTPMNGTDTNMTAAPTMNGTYAPTMMPTINGTYGPTMMPTMNTTAPTGMPTVMPTVMPTMMPTGMPTVTPTMMPTGMPTTMPTAKPTVSPSSAPSAEPTTAEPTFFPTPSGSSRVLSTVARSVLAASAAAISYVWI